MSQSSSHISLGSSLHAEQESRKLIGQNSNFDREEDVETVRDSHSQEEIPQSNTSSRSTTPRPFARNQSNLAGTGELTHHHYHSQSSQDNYLGVAKHNRDRRDSLSIQSLIATTDSRPTSSHQSNKYYHHHPYSRGEGSRREMNFGLASHLPSPMFDHTLPRDSDQEMTTSNSLLSTGSEYMQSPVSASSASFTSSNFGHQDSGSILDQDSFAALSNASKAANYGHTGEEGFGSYGTDHSLVSPYDSLSRSSSGFSLQSGLSGSDMSNAAGTQSDTQLLDGQTTHDGMIGRSRSGTVRRYHSLSGSLSLPPRSEESVSPTGSAMSLRASSDRGRGLATTASISISDASMNSSMSRKKRNKCSPEQFRQLEAFFAKNRNPTGKVREELAKSIRMPERSVQVWFQNKRAKTKLIEIKDGVPPELRTTVSKPRNSQGSATGMRPSESSSGFSTASARGKRAIMQTSSQEESVIQLPVVSLCIGTWRRIKPLICLFSRRQQAFTWYLSSESVGFKLECPRSCVTRVIFSGPRAPTVHEFGEGINTQIGHLTVELDRPPQFYMEVFRSSGASPKGKETEEHQQQKASWRQCSDFTESKQATTIFSHTISGPYAELRGAVLQLMESGGPLASIVELRDDAAGAFNGVSSGAWSAESHLAQANFHGHPNAQFGLPHQPYSHPHQAPHYVPAGQESSMLGHGLDEAQFANAPQHSQWDNNATPVSWQQANFSNDIASGHDGGRYDHLTINTAPQSASALDMNNLRIDTSALHSVHHQASHTFEDGNGQSTSYSPTNTVQWPRTAVHQSSTWANSGHPLSESGFASAPAYPINSFQQQQQQQQQQSHLSETHPSAIMSHSSSADGTGSVTDAAAVAAAAAAVNANEMHNSMFSQPAHVAAAANATGFNAAPSHQTQSTPSMEESGLDANMHTTATTDQLI
ncbi:uncharacterized protein FA14DRAFT_189145 [Meira miltonrushii]|uniref:Homeobox domain-containing protein n=1 Tax=Meira miltonrushii TaxID=1280837 RepID=A0A316VC52_9BASI|nr:uncharacterized protein FA14DRAFT_189145 [Meira miltonrushii]PWN35142.1 hypothetical protein FA14DRAFT_189145 [Meira miltonrushii]